MALPVTVDLPPEALFVKSVSADGLIIELIMDIDLSLCEMVGLMIVWLNSNWNNELTNENLIPMQRCPPNACEDSFSIPVAVTMKCSTSSPS